MGNRIVNINFLSGNRINLNQEGKIIKTIMIIGWIIAILLLII